jgi:hypothetical protein
MEYDPNVRPQLAEDMYDSGRPQRRGLTPEQREELGRVAEHRPQLAEDMFMSMTGQTHLVRYRRRPVRSREAD